MGHEVVVKNLRIIGNVRWDLCTKDRPFTLLVCLEQGTSLRHISLGRGSGFWFWAWVNEYGRMLSPSLPITREMGPAGNFTTKKRGKRKLQP